MTELVGLFMPGTVEWLNDTMAEIMLLMLIMRIVPTVRIIKVIMVPTNVVILLMVIVQMLMMQFEFMR